MIISKINGRAALTLIKIALTFVIATAFAIQSAKAQSTDRRIAIDDSLRNTVAAWEDSLTRLKPPTRPVYAGFDVSLGAPQYRINSNIEVLNNLPVNYLGAMVGGVLANPVGKLKGGIGIYYSGDNVPHSFDILAANLSVNLYLLRIKEVRYHSWEPYIFCGISEMRNKFYGHYLNDPSTKNNHSTTEQPYIGSVFSTHALAGAGVEYQLENDNRDFIHVYAELSLGSNIHTNAITDALSDSNVPRSLWITLGISFGKFK